MRNMTLKTAAENAYNAWVGGTMNDVREAMKDLGEIINKQKENKEREVNCYHFNLDLPDDGDYRKCRLIHEDCELCTNNPEDCIYYRIYEEANEQGYQEGKMGEDY